MKEAIQNKKIFSQKLYKNPDDFLYSESFLPYVLSLEEAGDLQRLPENLYVYYVLSVLENEVNNGGFLQYLTNRTKDTFKEVSFCADILNDCYLPHFTKVTLPSGPCGGDSIQVQVLLSAPQPRGFSRG
jgi:hypothetical protein